MVAGPAAWGRSVAASRRSEASLTLAIRVVRPRGPEDQAQFIAATPVFAGRETPEGLPGPPHLRAGARLSAQLPRRRDALGSDALPPAPPPARTRAALRRPGRPHRRDRPRPRARDRF